MKTPEQRVLEDKYAMLQLEYSELKDKYDQLCGKLKKNANDNRNVDNADEFLRSYASGDSGFWR
jgi:FtsZ-binding cell division protein ZapB